MMQPSAGVESHVGRLPTPPPHWVTTMQYPPAAMMMAPPPPPYLQHFLSYHHHHQNLPLSTVSLPPEQQQSASAASTSAEDNKTIWVGDLHYWMDESYLGNCFGYTGEEGESSVSVHSIKIIRNKKTGQSEGYGFVEFKSHATAEKVLQSFNGHLMPNAEQAFRLNWATFSIVDRRSDATSDHSIFVGDLATDVTDTMLLDTFVNKYLSVKGAKVVIDANTGRSKGYGFVRFGDMNEKTRAMSEMNGVYCSSRPMRIGAATPRKPTGGNGSNGASAQGFQADGDFSNTTVFVGGLDPSVSEDDLKQTFSQYGEIASVKIPVGKQCGFVQFVNRNNAEEAMQGLNGSVLGKQTVRLSWGRSPANKQGQFRAEAVGNHWNGGGVFYGGHVYNGYGYTLPFQDSTGMYAAAAYSPYYFGSQPQVS